MNATRGGRRIDQRGGAPAGTLLAGRLAGLAGEAMVSAIVLGLVFGRGLGVHYVTGPDALVPLILAILDALADVLFMRTLVLRVASIGAVGHVFDMAIMFFGGMMVPVSASPRRRDLRQDHARLGTEALGTTLAGRGLGAAWAGSTW